MRAPRDSVRGIVRGWLEKSAHLLGDNVLEIGSRMSFPGAWWQDNRDLVNGKWTGLDFQPGDNVQIVADAHRLASVLPEDEYTGIICSEVLEHLHSPWIALEQMHRVLRAEGWIVITTLFAFPEHGYPNDYYRFTQNGLEHLLRMTGFRRITTAWSTRSIHIVLDDHGDGLIHERDIPMHVFAIAQK